MSNTQTWNDLCKSNIEQQQKIAELNDFRAGLLRCVKRQREEITALKKENAQLKAENASMAAYAEQRINMLKKTNGNLVSENAELKAMNGRLNEFLLKSFNEYNSTGKLSAKIKHQGGTILAESEILIYGSDREGES